MGLSFAAHQNSVATAQSQYADLGPVGAALIGEACSNNGEASGPGTFKASDFPQYVRVDSRDADAAQGQTIEAGNLITEFAKATGRPLGHAVTTIAPLAISSLLQLGSTTVTATSQVLDGNIRQANASVDVDSLSIGGLLELQSLRWEAISRSGDKAENTGTFTIGRINLAGIPLPTSTAQAGMDLANALLGQLGIVLTLPRSRESGGVEYIDPLTIDIIPNATRDSVSLTLLDALQPVRQALVDQLVAADCDLGTDITVLDGIIGSLTGAGNFTIAVGGAQASTGTVKLSGFLAPDKTVAPTAGGTGLNPRIDLGIPSGGDLSAGPALPPTQDLATGVAPPAVARTARSDRAKGARGGALLVVGLAALAFFALMAEADRRKIRKVQRQILEGP